MHANIKTFNIYHKELSIPSNNKTLKLKLVLLHVEFEVCFFFLFFSDENQNMVLRNCKNKRQIDVDFK